MPSRQKAKWSALGAFAGAFIGLPAAAAFAQNADLRLEKVALTPQVQVGQDASFRLYVANTGTTVAREVQIIDQLPSQLVFKAPPPPPAGAPPAFQIIGNTVTLFLPPLPPGAQTSVTLIANAVAPGNVVNKADVLAAGDDPTPGNNHSEASVSIAAPTNGGGGDDPQPETSAPAYLIIGRDNRPIPPTSMPNTSSGTDFGSVLPTQSRETTFGVYVSGPAPVEFDSEPIRIFGSEAYSVLEQPTPSVLEPGAFAVFRVKFAPAGPGIFNGGFKVRTVSPDLEARYYMTGNAGGFNSDVQINPIGQDPAPATSTLRRFRLSARNNGPDAAPNTRILVSVQPANIEEPQFEGGFVDVHCGEVPGTFTLDFGAIAPGGEATASLALQFRSGGGYAVTAKALSSSVDPFPANNGPTTVTLTVQGPTLPPPGQGSANLRVELGPKPQEGPVRPGQQAAFRLIVRNDGPSTASDVITSAAIYGPARNPGDDAGPTQPINTADGPVVPAPNPAFFALFPAGSMPPGGVRFYDISTTAVVAGGWAAEVRTRAAAPVDPQPENNYARSVIRVEDSSTTAPPPPPGGGPVADLRLRVTPKQAESPIRIGDVARFEVELENYGPTTATDILTSVALFGPLSPETSAPSTAAAYLLKTIVISTPGLSPSAHREWELATTVTGAGIYVAEAVSFATSPADPFPGNNRGRAEIRIGDGGTTTPPPPPPAAEGTSVRVFGSDLYIANGDSQARLDDGTDFGTTSVLSGRLVSVFVIRNIGAEPVNVYGAVVGGQNPGDFRILNVTTGTIGVGQNGYVQVAFNPIAVGPRYGVIMIGSNDATAAQYRFAVRGVGSISCEEQYGCFVDRLYNDILGRPSDPAGRAWFVDRMCHTTSTLAEVVREFLSSPEFADTAGFASRCYFGIFNDNSAVGPSDPNYRIPDRDGLLYWTQELRRRGSNRDARRSVVAGFTNSNEWVTRVGDRDNAGFVDFLYQNILGRVPDATGRAYFITALEGGANRVDLALAFLDSNEARGRYRARTLAAIAYLGLLDRAAEHDGFAYHSELLENGVPDDDVISGFIESNEYGNRLIDRGCQLPDWLGENPENPEYQPEPEIENPELD